MAAGRFEATLILLNQQTRMNFEPPATLETTVAKRTCIFCGATPLTREHVFPRWMGETLSRDPRRLQSPYKFERWNLDGDEPPSNRSEWVSKSPLDFVAKCVCKTCNSGWMSDIETAAKPIVVPMIEGHSVELDATSQSILGAWACMKTVLSGYAYRPPVTVPEDWLEHICEDRRPPPHGWVVLATRYVGRRPALFARHRLELFNRENDKPQPDNEGIMMSLVVGYLALKAIGVRRKGVSNSGTPFVQVWPTSPLTLLWPPRAQISDEMLEDFLSPVILFRGSGTDPLR